MRHHQITRAVALAAAIAALAASGASARPRNLSSPDARDAAAGRVHTSSLDGTSLPPQEVVVAPAPAPAAGGFDWGDAGIGAAAGLGLALAGVAGSLAVVGKRRHATVS